MRPWRVLAILAGLLSTAIAVANPIAYTVTSDSNGADQAHLYQIDLATGAATDIGNTGFAGIEGLSFDSSGTLFGIDDFTRSLVTIDLGTGAASLVNGTLGNTGLPVASYDWGLSFACNGTLFATDDLAGSTYSLDPATGVATLLTSGQPQITGLAARYDGLYSIGSNGDENLYRVDPTSGVATLIGPLGAGLNFNDGGLAADASGGLWGISDETQPAVGPGIFDPSIVFTVNALTGAATIVNTTSLIGAESLAINAPGACSAVGMGIPGVPTLDSIGSLVLFVLLAGLGIVSLRKR